MTTPDAPIAAVLDGERKSRLLYLARRRYGLGADAAEDLLQAALLTFWQVRDRYPREDEHVPILVGIFRNKCRESVTQRVRESSRSAKLRTRLEAGTVGVARAQAPEAAQGGLLQGLVAREDGRKILEALASLRPAAREFLMLLGEGGLSRAQMIERYKLNPNTLDSRLRTYRNELRRELRRRDIDA